MKLLRDCEGRLYQMFLKVDKSILDFNCFVCLFTLRSSNKDKIASVVLLFDLNPNWINFFCFGIFYIAFNSTKI